MHVQQAVGEISDYDFDFLFGVFSASVGQIIYRSHSVI